MQNAGKGVQASRGVFWFYFWLDDKVAGDLKPIA